MDKRTFLKTGTLLGLGSMVPGSMTAHTGKWVDLSASDMPKSETGEYVLPPLPYAYDALEPYIDEATMRLHHDIHHAGYVKGLNNATKKVSEAMDSNDFGLIKHWGRELAFHGAGHFLHSIFWQNMGPEQGIPGNTLTQYVNKGFGSFDRFKKLYAAATQSVEGSGWGILAYQPDADKLVVLQAEKHQNQSQWVSIPILVCDVWEHAYYLKYQNKRGDYINGFLNVVNWNAVSQRFEKLLEAYN